MEAFHAENPTHKLIQTLYGGAFGCGLPMVKELEDQPDMVMLFRNLLKYGVVDRNEDEDTSHSQMPCHGWIHANQAVNGTITHYAFLSPLHTVSFLAA